MQTSTKPIPLVLVTGAAGRIGSDFASRVAERYRLRLMVMPGQEASKIKEFGEVVEADLADPAALQRACVGIDACVHLAGEANPGAPWERLLSANVIGTYNLFTAALAAGCRRMVYASSIHAVSGYANDVQVKTSEPVFPGDVYGVTKCFGEALARCIAGETTMGVVAIRIDAFADEKHVVGDGGLPVADAWVSPRDLTQLIERAIDTPGVKFAIVHGLSDCTFKRLDLSNAREVLGYAPQDDAFESNPALRAVALRDKLIGHDHAVQFTPTKIRVATASIREP